jgi:hypothetical protein
MISSFQSFSFATIRPSDLRSGSMFESIESNRVDNAQEKPEQSEHTQSNRAFEHGVFPCQ